MSKDEPDKIAYEKLGRAISGLFQSEYLNTKLALRNSFLRGLVTGLGGVIGATLMAAILVWFLSLFGQVPLIGHFVEKTRDTIQMRSIR